MIVIIKKDGIEKAKVDNENDAFVWLLTHQGQSVDFATRFNGWSVEDEDGNVLFKTQSKGGQTRLWKK